MQGHPKRVNNIIITPTNVKGATTTYMMKLNLVYIALKSLESILIIFPTYCVLIVY
jgi:hypothetical protein